MSMLLGDALRVRAEEANRVVYSKVVDVLCAAADTGAYKANVPARMLDDQVLARLEANGVIIEDIPGPWKEMSWRVADVRLCVKDQLSQISEFVQVIREGSSGH